MSVVRVRLVCQSKIMFYWIEGINIDLLDYQPALQCNLYGTDQYKLVCIGLSFDIDVIKDNAIHIKKCRKT